MNQVNCWEFKKCGRESCGKNLARDGVCPSAISNEFDGVNGGKYAGRFCWGVAGALCGDKPQGTTARLIKDCSHCNFFQQVVQDHGLNFAITVEDARKQQENKKHQ